MEKRPLPDNPFLPTPEVRQRPHRGRSQRGLAVFVVVTLSLSAMFSASAAAQTPAPAAPAPADDAAPKSAPVDFGRDLLSTPSDDETPPPLSDAERYRRGQNHFEFGDCEKVIETLQELSVPGRLADEDRLVETHRMLGVCYFQLGRRAAAERELKGLLYIKPEYVLDPFLTPPPVVELFAELRTDVQKKIAEINAAKTTVKPPVTVILEREITEQETPLFGIFVPFGGAQLLNGEPVKAGILGGLQGMAIAANVAAFWAVQTIVLTNPTGKEFVTGDPLGTVHDGLLIAMPVALGTWALVYGYSVADAWWNWTPKREVSKTETRRDATKDDTKRLR